MNFGGNEIDNGISYSMRSPASARRPSQASSFRGQQSPLHQGQQLQYQQVQQLIHPPSGGSRTPNSRYNTPSKGLPKRSTLGQGGTTPVHGEQTPAGGTPYSARPGSGSRMSTGFPASPSGLSTPGRRGVSGGRMTSLHSDYPQQQQQQYQPQQYSQDSSRMDESYGGGNLFNSVDLHDDYNDSSRYSNQNNQQMTNGGGFGGPSTGLRQRGPFAASTPGDRITCASGGGSASGGGGGGAMLISQAVSKSMFPHWVIVFGLPAHVAVDSPCAIANVLKLFQGHGEIDNYHTSPGNWLLIKFSSTLDANNAAGVLHRTFLTSEVMIGVELVTPELAKKLNLSFQLDGQLVVTPGKQAAAAKKFNRVEQQGRANSALLDPDYDNIMRPPRRVTKDICTRIFEFFMY